jgi:capsular polysaccharide biosynthesis protein
VKQRAATIIFAHKLLIILPLLIALAVTSALALLPQPQQWQSSAYAWVESPQVNWFTMDLGWSPSGDQVGFLNALIHTDDFSSKVIQQTPLAYGLQNPRTVDATKKYFWESISITSQNENLMGITVTMRDPTTAYKTAQAILTNYQQVLAARGKSVTDQSLTNADQQLKQAEQNLVDAHTQLANYIAAHPNLLNQTGTVNSLSVASDVNYQLLQQQVADAQASYSGARQAYGDVVSSEAAGQRTQNSAFEVIQQPQMPAEPVHVTLLTRLKLPGIGLALGLLLSGCVAALLILTDRSVLTPYDVLSGLKLPVLGEVPNLTPYGRRTLAGDVRRQLAASAR